MQQTASNLKRVWDIYAHKTHTFQDYRLKVAPGGLDFFGAKNSQIWADWIQIWHSIGENPNQCTGSPLWDEKPKKVLSIMAVFCQ